jgi:YidC/Oxa1 family membrane protein insertase
MRRAGFDEAFQIGMLGQIGLVLLSALMWTAGITHNYGVAIVLFSLALTALTAPFTMISLRSMKKMQELKPAVDRLMAQHKDEPKKANAAIFALYKEHRVSPMSGCLPMLLQMPILIAMFQAISHFIELRGEVFLWIKDLSMPDRAATLPVEIPYLGNALNALPILIAVAMYIQTRISQASTGQANTDPTARILSGPLMPIMFGAMFYHAPAGLGLYWLTNSIASLAWYRLAK